VIPRAHASHRDQIVHVREVDGHLEHVGKIRPECCKRSLNVLADQFDLLFDCAIDALASRGMTGRDTCQVGDIAHTRASGPAARRIVVKELDTGRAGRKVVRNPSRRRRCLDARWCPPALPCVVKNSQILPKIALRARARVLVRKPRPTRLDVRRAPRHYLGAP
jgi:hypothetical protein